MKINHVEYTISELLEMLERKEIFINRTYQRGAGLWPDTAKTYFIDTILEGFPFPKLYFYQSLNKENRKPIREIVDGQQRITTIQDFVGKKFKLGSASANYKDLSFDHLDEDKQNEFLMYTVPVDMILAADRPLLLEMFRRINAYTAPLNAAEKRHSEYQGPFKWFINDLADKYSPILEKFEVLTPKQIIRMGDAELLAELMLVIDQGIINKSSKSLKDIYKKYDKSFGEDQRFNEVVSDFFKTLSTDLILLRDTFMMKSYVLHSLFTAMTHLKYGIPNGAAIIGCNPIGKYYANLDKAIKGLLQLAEAHEMQDERGPHREYVTACLSTTTKARQRIIRSKAITNVLLTSE